MYHGNLAASVAARMAHERPAVAWNVRHSLYGLATEKLFTRQVIRANRLLSGHADVILYHSRRSKEQHENFGFASGRGLVIANGFDTRSLRPSAGVRDAVRQALGLSGDALVVGHVARYHPMKDRAGFLRSALQVARAEPRARFLLVGRDVELRHPALRGIVPSGLEERFLCPGERSDVHELMQGMDMFCSSSSWGKAFPNVVGEAMALGVPCGVTDVGDSRDIVGPTGVIVPPRAPDALARAVLELLSRSAEDRRSLGRRARARIDTRYALPDIVRRYGEVYDGAARWHRP